MFRGDQKPPHFDLVEAATQILNEPIGEENVEHLGHAPSRLGKPREALDGPFRTSMS